jgi:trans-2,3-dihydro-3-hydroxyanthranilate isomerase
LGTAFVIQREIVGDYVDELILNLKIGQIPVAFGRWGKKSDVLWMKQIPPTFGHTFDSSVISKVLSLDVKDIDNRFPVEEVSTGVPFIVVPLRTFDALKKCRILGDEYFELIKDSRAKAILVFCPETYSEENDLCVRVFADYYGVPEDPATGSANGCLAGYLVKNQYFGKDQIDIRVEQGYEIGRPSLLFLRSESKKEEIGVCVGGRVVMVGRGELLRDG